MTLGKTATIGAVALLCTGALVGAPSPAGAEVPSEYQLLAGNFVGDARDELFYYQPGSGPEFLSDFTQDGSYAYHNLLGQFTVNGTYQPLVGDFDGDDFDEILWYAPGTATDYLWNFTSSSSVSSVAYTVNGSYPRATVGDYTGDGVDDVLWYAPGTAPDYLWDYNAGGGYTSVRRTINGTYLPVSGSFGNDATDDIFWYAPGTARDYLWDYVPGGTTFTSQPYSVNDTRYRPLSLDMLGEGPGNEDILWYAPGTAADYTWDFYLGQMYSYRESVSGEYLTAAGDFFGDGMDDVIFDTYDRMVMWEHTSGPTRVAWTWSYVASTTEAPDTLSAASEPAASDRARRTGEVPLPAKP